MSKITKEVAKETIDRRQFGYNKNGVNLNFTLRTDTPSELQIFKELLIMAVNDIEILLKKFEK